MLESAENCKVLSPGQKFVSYGQKTLPTLNKVTEKKTANLSRFTFCLSHKVYVGCLPVELDIVNVVSSTLLVFGVL